MQTITLYRYTRQNGGVTVSPNKPDSEYTNLYRLIADEGMILSNGSEQTFCVDTEDPGAWTELDHEEDISATEV